MSQPAFVIRPESPPDEDAIERLHDRTFGPGRYARSAYRLREGAGAAPPQHCYAAVIGTLLVGSIRMTPVMAGERPALVLGPLTVDPSFEGVGIGGALVRKALDAAREAGESLVLLVGDLPYYRRFGFEAAPRRHFVMPGPVNPERLLALELQPGALQAAGGPIRPRPAS